MLSFIYKDSEFEAHFPYTSNGVCGFCGSLSLVSTSSKVLEIPDTYDGVAVKSVYIGGCFNNSKSNVFEYHVPSAEDSYFYSIEEIHIPASLRDIQIDRKLFPNLNKVIVDSENKNYRIVDEKLLCTGDNYLIAYCSNDEIEEYAIPEVIKGVGMDAFSFTKIHKIKFPDSVHGITLDCVRHSYFLQDFEDVVEFAGVTHALKKEIDEFIITDFKKLGSSIFYYSLPKKIILDVKTTPAYWLSFSEVDTVELRNPEFCIANIHKFCANFQHLIVNPENKNYCVIDDVLFSKDKTKLLLYPCYRVGEKYEVPEGTLEIAPYAFYGSICNSIQLPTTLLEFHSTSFCNLYSLQELIIPETKHAIKFESISANNLKYFKFPKSMNILGTNTVSIGGAVVDATEVEYFGAGAFASCKELIISNKTKNAARGAFGHVDLLKTPELKLYRFVEALFPEDYLIISGSEIIHYVEITRENGSVLNLAFPILGEQDYMQAIFSVWGIYGINIEGYVNALAKIKRTEQKYKAIIYCLENNHGELVEALLSRIGRMARGLILWAIKNDHVNTAALLCKSGIVKSTLAKELLKGELPNVFVPIIMSVLNGGYSESRLSL